MLEIERFLWTECQLRHKTDGSRRDAAQSRDGLEFSAMTADLSASLLLADAELQTHLTRKIKA